MGNANFSEEFKRDAVAQITERGYRVAEVSERLGVSQHSLYSWRKQFGKVASGDAGKDAEIRQLKRDLARMTEERDILKKPPRISPEMRSEIRFRCRASGPVWSSGDVPVPGGPAQRLLCLAEESTEPPGTGGCPANCTDPAGLEGQRQGLWLPQAARRSARSGRDLLPQSRCPPDQPGRHQGADRLQAAAGQFSRKAFGRRCQHPGSPVRRGAADHAWVTDITYIRTMEGFAYLAVVLDLYSRRVVGWSLQSRQTTDVVLQALHMAVWRRKPKNRVLIHSDQGSQFTSIDWAAFIRAHNLEHSMSAGETATIMLSLRAFSICSSASASGDALTKHARRPRRTCSIISRCSITRSASMPETGCCRPSSSNGSRL